MSDERNTDDSDLWRVVPWRVGRSLGRTIYRMVDTEASKDDQVLGMMDTRQIAAHIVDLHNKSLEGQP